MTDRIVTRLWQKDTSVFSVAADPAVRAAIEHRLGWLEAPAAMRAHIDEIAGVVSDVRRDGLTSLCLLGMGGSSLCAEVLRQTLAPVRLREHVHVLDTTDERVVRTISATLDPATTLFVVASKSGSTIEVTALEAHFRAWVASVGIAEPGRHFIAITDPDTALVAHASAHGYRHTFINPADIGGRFSALSLFGLVPAALMDIDPASLLDAADTMVGACRLDGDEAEDNPGLALGHFMAEQSLAGRDKLTLLLPDAMAALGLWVEQLVAESTGKLGRGVLPIVDEPAATVGELDDYGLDRAFVLIADPADDAAVPRRQALAAAGHPVLHLQSTPAHLGAEFFRWEFATAVAGIALDVNPFDEPNVRDAKSRTQALLSRGTPLPVDPPLVERDGILGRSHRVADINPTGSFVAILDYLPPDARRTAAVALVRASIRHRTQAATTYGAGPRYLHSTGQFHKGGTNAGLFLLLTADDETATEVPGTDYTFSRLKHAQALGDYEALCANHRHVVHIHVRDAGADFSAEMERLINWAMRH
jgi:transaldolase/glucose-6-phosphate isomerase